MNLAEAIQDYVKPELLVVIIVLYIIGEGIKKTEKIDNKYIPIIVGVLGIIIASLYIIATTTFNNYQSIIMAIFTAIIQGILIAGASVYVNELIKQAKN